MLSIDPATGERERDRFTDAWQQVVLGAGAHDLPAYRFQPPCDALLAGLDPPASTTGRGRTPGGAGNCRRRRAVPLD